jgi:uncharacterized membrane protein
MDNRDAERQREARRVLDRAARESETLAGSSFARAAGQAGGEDRIERIGRLIGRTLGAIAAIALIVWLFANLSGPR